MNFSKVFSAQLSLLNAKLISVEADVSFGLHKFSIIGLPDKAIEESKDRISSAIKYSDFNSPKTINQKIVISLAPAHIKKSGANFDLAIAVAYLKATNQINFNEKDKIFIGELSLDGKVRPIQGILPIIKFASENNFKEIFIPYQNRREASLIKNIKIFPVKNLKELVDHLKSKSQIVPQKNLKIQKEFIPSIDYADIIGQEKAKRALLISACGGHNISLFGPPGTGKTMIARTLSGILPELSYEQTIETTSIHSISYDLKGEIITWPPFRAPHHSASPSSMTGGGFNLKPGEITLAHNGVLFLDEFPEFDKRVIEILRQPLEDKIINISRVNNHTKLPANFIFIVAMNPCPCGYYKSNIKKCTCPQSAIQKYQKKISGPIIDRIDMWIEVKQQENLNLFLKREEKQDEKSIKIRNVVETTRLIQKERFKELKINLNSEIQSREINNFCKLKKENEVLLKEACIKMKLSTRSFYKILKISRTIADLEKSIDIKREHLLEALQYRPKNIGDY